MILDSTLNAGILVFAFLLAVGIIVYLLRRRKTGAKFEIGYTSIATEDGPATKARPRTAPEEPKTEAPSTLGASFDFSDFLRSGDLFGSALSGSLVRVFYATDRKLGQFTNSNDFYLNERDERQILKYGVCEVSIPGAKRHHIGRLERPSIWRLEFKEDPNKHVIVVGVCPQARDQFFAAVQERLALAEGKAILVFIHGYNVSFADAVMRAAQLSYDLQFEGAPILYTWPSRADAREYPIDETNVAWTVPQLRAFLLDLCKTTQAKTIHLIAHSMGNRALSSALHDIALEYKPGGIERDLDLPLFHHVVLTAPDIDAETFRALAEVFKPTARRITVYSCFTDKALAISRTFHGYRRAGDCALMLPGIDAIDASAVDTSLLRHSYFAESRSVVSDIYSLLKEDKTPEHRFGMSRVSTGDGTYYAFKM